MLKQNLIATRIVILALAPKLEFIFYLGPKHPVMLSAHSCWKVLPILNVKLKSFESHVSQQQVTVH